MWDVGLLLAWDSHLGTSLLESWLWSLVYTVCWTGTPIESLAFTTVSHPASIYSNLRLSLLDKYPQTVARRSGARLIANIHSNLYHCLASTTAVLLVQVQQLSFLRQIRLPPLHVFNASHSDPR
jgi:hypothetical protein